MLRWAIAFFVIALIAGALGFYGLADTSATIAKVFALVFIVLFLAALVFGRTAVTGPPI